MYKKIFWILFLTLRGIFSFDTSNYINILFNLSKVIKWNKTITINKVDCENMIKDKNNCTITLGNGKICSELGPNTHDLYKIFDKYSKW